MTNKTGRLDAMQRAAQAAMDNNGGLAAPAPLQAALATAIKAANDNCAKMKPYEALPSQVCLFRDILNDGTNRGIAFHRLQVLA